MSPTPAAIRLAALGLPLALLPSLLDGRFWPAWIVFAAWLGLALGLDALLLPRGDQVRLDFDHPELLFIGDEETAAATLTVDRRWGMPYELRIDANERLAETPTHRGRTRADGERSAWPLVPVRRGTARLERAWLRVRGPLGLMRRQWTLPLERELSVVPNTRRVRAVALRFFSHNETLEGLKLDRGLGDGSEFESIKEFVIGDDSRRIDWKHSARHHKLLVRQFRAERNHQIVLAVDTGRLMTEVVDGIPKLDHALNAALLLSYVGLKTGDRVGMYAFDAEVGPYVRPRAGVTTQLALSRTAAGLNYSAVETNFTLGLTNLDQQLTRRSLVIVLTDFVDTVTAELMIENCARLARKHLLLFVALRDANIARIAERLPASELELSRAAMAQRFLDEREVVFRRLRELGIQTIDAEPAHVTAPLINRYLDIKRRERI